MSIASFVSRLERTEMKPVIVFRRELARCATAAIARCALLSVLLFGALDLQADSKPTDLGDGLLYVRVHTAATDLPPGESVREHPCVLDLRFAHGDAVAATVLASWVSSHAANRNPIFVLVNGSTAAPLIAALTEHRISGLLMVGIEGQAFSPDIMVKQSSDDERRAYDALDHGATIAALTTDNPDKQRNDEASLSHPTDAATDRDDSTTTESTAPPAPKSTPPPTDAALQRAIQLHRALRAMKKL
jgi:hypothetical protein